MDASLPESYRDMTGGRALDSGAFREHRLSLGVCYGLALAALGQASIDVNLLLPELQARRKWARRINALVQAVQAVPSRVDGLLARIAGPDNTIVHRFLRCLLIALPVAIGIVWALTRPEMPDVPSVQAPIHEPRP